MNDAASQGVTTSVTTRSTSTVEGIESTAENIRPLYWFCCEIIGGNSAWIALVVLFRSCCAEPRERRLNFSCATGLEKGLVTFDRT
jgi:hypothetical protein